VGVALEPSWISSDGIEIALHDDSIQRINEIPMMQHDIHMNMIITPSTFLSLRN
jgi:5-formyltetrahydrofolate cyclo-ligase